MNPIILAICNAIQLVIFIPAILSVLYLFFFAVTGASYRQPVYPADPEYLRIAVLIPAYKEDDVICESAMDALRQDYPREFYDVVVIADSLRSQTVENLNSLPVILLEVSFDKSTKVKALNRAMEYLEDQYDLAVIIDADNLMSDDFLSKVNACFNRDVTAVQGHRTAGNLDSPLAVLDSASEEINNHIFRKGHRAAGLSSALIGSGMAFRYGYFRQLISGMKAVGGFDKEIELKLLKNGKRIEYLDDAYVFDEKVSRPKDFTNQRRRWLSAQLHYFRKDFPAAVKALIAKGNVDYFDKAIQFILPPRSLLLGSLVIFGTIFCIMNSLAGNPRLFSLFWAGTLILYLITLMLSVPVSFYNARTMAALLILPKGFFLMVRSLFTIKGVNREFLHTKHGMIHTNGHDSINTNKILK